MTTKTKAASLVAGKAASNTNVGNNRTTAKTVLSGQPHKTQRSTSAQVLARLEAAKRILKAIQPCSVRAVCYQLFNTKLIVTDRPIGGAAHCAGLCRRAHCRRSFGIDAEANGTRQVVLFRCRQK